VQTRGAGAADHGIEDGRDARLRALSRSVGTADGGPVAVAAAVVVLLVVLWKFTVWLDRRLERREERRAMQRYERAAVAFRAGAQHAWVLAGDDRGIYGEYTPTEL
jgi:hypothetical protein